MPHKQIHHVLAQAIEQTYPDDDIQAIRLSNHWFAAGEADKASYYAEVAGKQALNRTDYRQA